jgi:hypothetical protein
VAEAALAARGRREGAGGRSDRSRAVDIGLGVGDSNRTPVPSVERYGNRRQVGPDTQTGPAVGPIRVAGTRRAVQGRLKAGIP